MNKAIEDSLLLNQQIKENNLVKLTWGNASVLSEDGKYIAIKPSGVDFDKLFYVHKELVTIAVTEYEQVRA